MSHDQKAANHSHSVPFLTAKTDNKKEKISRRCTSFRNRDLRFGLKNNPCFKVTH